MPFKGGSPDSKSSEIVFFFGAGASVAAGVPTTFSFVNEFVESIQDPEKKATIIKIVETLETWRKEKIDIELLLDTLTKLNEKDQEPLLPFFPGGTYLLKDYYEKEPLINDLKDFIKSKAIVESEERIRYLEPFREFIEDSRPLDIISVNYDTSIEQFCNYYRLTYQDGFEVNWDPSVFLKEHTDIRLYKIHGSVMWYQSDRGGYLKLPVMTRESNIQLISGEKAENLMLYPMKKWDLAVPLLELLVETKRLIESEVCKIIVIVGYSFRDDHVKRILFDAARKNNDLILILIDPKASQIYSDKLKYYDSSQKLPSSFAGKVICLPFPFEKIFPEIKNHYVKKIIEGLSFESAQRKLKVDGQQADWIACLRSFADAEYTEKNETILERETIDILKYWPIMLEIFMKMAISYHANNDTQKGKVNLNKFYDLLKILMIKKTNIEFFDLSDNMFVGYQIRIQFNYIAHYDPNTNQKRGSSSSNINQFLEILNPLIVLCENRRKMMVTPNIELEKISKKLIELFKYLTNLDDGNISLKDFRRIRSQDIKYDPRLMELLERGRLTQDEKSDIFSRIKMIEKSTLEKILNSE